MKVKTPAVGGVAISTQGRDKGIAYIICGIEKDFVFLADGKIRTVAEPKKKNVKHVRLLPRNACEDGLGYPFDKSSDVRIAYYLKKLADGVEN